MIDHTDITSIFGFTRSAHIERQRERSANWRNCHLVMLGNIHVSNAIRVPNANYHHSRALRSAVTSPYAPPGKGAYLGPWASQADLYVSYDYGVPRSRLRPLAHARASARSNEPGNAD